MSSQKRVYDVVTLNIYVLTPHFFGIFQICFGMEKRRTEELLSHNFCPAIFDRFLSSPSRMVLRSRMDFGVISTSSSSLM